MAKRKNGANNPKQEELSPGPQMAVLDAPPEAEVVEPVAVEGALVSVERQRAVAETQAALVIARRFPRDTIASVDRIRNACARPKLAETALYQYARGGTDITGPSIRLAEAMAQAWGNIQFGIRELEQSGGKSTVEAYAWDVETNVRAVKIFQVPHKRYTKRGSYALDDPRDIYETVANQGARRLRACILSVIPGDVVEDAVNQCNETLAARAKVTPDRLQAMEDKFAEIGISRGQIEKRIQRHLDAMTPAQMVMLGRIYNSIKDGMSTPAEWFEVESDNGEKESLKEKLEAMADDDFAQ